MRFLGEIGQKSFGIYLIHPLIIPIFTVIINPIYSTIPSYLIYIEYAVLVIASFGIVKLIGKSKLLKILIAE